MSRCRIEDFTDSEQLGAHPPTSSSPERSWRAEAQKRTPAPMLRTPAPPSTNGNGDGLAADRGVGFCSDFGAGFGASVGSAIETMTGRSFSPSATTIDVVAESAGAVPVTRI